VQYEIEVNGQVRQVVLRRIGEQFSVTVDGRELIVDAARIGADAMSLLVRDPNATASASATERTKSHDVVLTPGGAGQVSVSVGPVPLSVSLNGGRRSRSGNPGQSGGTGPERVVAPMPGRIVKVLVARGETVRARQGLVVMEAMKMENELRAARDGVVSEVHVAEGQLVDANTLLAVIASV
jgi:biotin carboxyl carrier protein